MVSKRSLKLFHAAAKELPAYQRFLKANKVDPSAIKTPKDFCHVPVTNKSNYLRKHKLKDLVWQYDQQHPLLFCATSGSTGEPYYFPRNEKLSWQYSLLVEDFLKQNPPRKGGKTLVIIGFGMGVWIGGVITLRAFEIASARMGVPVAILPAGYNPTEIYKALKKLAPEFQQTIIIGYPPFIKELVDGAVKQDINFKKMHVRFMFAAEAFTETFRNYLAKKAAIKDPVLDTLSIYGTADIGAMAYETPVSILIRRLAVKKPSLFRDIFGQIEKTPTLAQYNPQFVEFEMAGDQVLLTGNSAIPLIRYAVGDNGGVISFKQMEQILHVNGIDLRSEIKKAKIEHAVREQPFVFVYERADFSTTLHGINIYPEFIKEGLFEKILAANLTERFTMITKQDKKLDQYLEINLELKDGIKTNLRLKNAAHRIIRQKLIEKSSEFAEIAKTRNSKNLIKLVFWSNMHPKYFSPGVKQKWVQKED